MVEWNTYRTWTLDSGAWVRKFKNDKDECDREDLIHKFSVNCVVKLGAPHEETLGR